MAYVGLLVGMGEAFLIEKGGIHDDWVSQNIFLWFFSYSFSSILVLCLYDRGDG